MAHFCRHRTMELVQFPICTQALAALFFMIATFEFFVANAANVAPNSQELTKVTMKPDSSHPCKVQLNEQNNPASSSWKNQKLKGSATYNINQLVVNCSDPELFGQANSDVTIEETQPSQIELWKKNAIIVCTVIAAVEILIVFIIVLYWKQIRWTMRKITCPCDESSSFRQRSLSRSTQSINNNQSSSDSNQNSSNRYHQQQYSNNFNQSQGCQCVTAVIHHHHSNDADVKSSLLQKPHLKECDEKISNPNLEEPQPGPSYIEYDPGPSTSGLYQESPSHNDNHGRKYFNHQQYYHYHIGHIPYDSSDEDMSTV